MSTKVSRISEITNKETRLLLFLWDMVKNEEKVKKSELNKRLRQKAGNYKEIYKHLENTGAIAITKEKRIETVSITDKGKHMLGEGLKSPEFEAEAGVGTKTVSALLKWIREQGTPINGAVSNGAVASADKAKSSKSAIASYDEFKQVALDVYDQLNRDYNLNDLVPIYRIRHILGDRVSRSHFNEWLLEMQANDIFQLMAGEMPDLTPDKRDDSITIPGGGLRYYAKHLNF
jgi:predicted transcriptional regulator